MLENDDKHFFGKGKCYILGILQNRLQSSEHCNAYFGLEMYQGVKTVLQVDITRAVNSDCLHSATTLNKQTNKLKGF